MGYGHLFAHQIVHGLSSADTAHRNGEGNAPAGQINFQRIGKPAHGPAGHPAADEAEYHILGGILQPQQAQNTLLGCTVAQGDIVKQHPLLPQQTGDPIALAPIHHGNHYM